MIIPNKFNGYYNGVRRCFGGGGGGGGGGDGGDAGGGDAGGGDAGGGGGGGGDAYVPPTNTNTGNTTFNPNRGSITGMNFTGSNTAGTSTIPRDNLNLRNMYGTPYNQSGQQYNALLQQGFTGNDIRNALTTNGKPVSDSDYGFLVQDAGMKSPTGRPMAGSDQFFQPVYNSSYMNYARPATQFDTSTYGTQPVQSPLFASGASRQNISNAIGNYFQQNPNSDINSTLAAMRDGGVNRTDIQAYGGFNNYGPQMSFPQMQTPFNPYSNSSGYGGFGGMGGYMPQMQSPFSYQPSYQSSYGGYGSGYDNSGYFTPMQPAPMPQRTSSGPSQAIVSRSSQMRGTPNVMRRAEGGIASLMDKDE
jgi:hypothetical protein